MNKQFELRNSDGERVAVSDSTTGIILDALNAGVEIMSDFTITYDGQPYYSPEYIPITNHY